MTEGNSGHRSVTARSQTPARSIFSASLPWLLRSSSLRQLRVAALQQPQADAQVGQRVVQKRPDFAVHADNEPDARSLAIDVWRVEKVDGPRIFLTTEKFGITGWASSDQIISIEKGVDYFSQQIRERPSDAFAYRDACHDLA